MAGSSSQAPGSPGHPAASHQEAYANAFRKKPVPLKAADGTALPFNFSRPEPGFDPKDDSAVREFFKFQNGARHVLDMAGQQGPTIEEQVERQVRELTRLRGHEVNGEEREIIERTLRRNAGWLESYKAEVAGADTVPIGAFNRLARDYERMQLEMARDRANYEADYIKELKQLEDKVQKLEGGGTVKRPFDYEPQSNEFRIKVFQLTRAVAGKDRLIANLNRDLEEAQGKHKSGREDELEQARVKDAAKMLWLEGDVNRLKAEVARLKSPGSEGPAADQSNVAELERTIERLQRQITTLEEDVGQQTTDATNWKRELDHLKRENQELTPLIKELEEALADSSKTNSEETESHGQERAQLETRVSELEAQLKAEQEKCQGEKRRLQEEIGQLRQNGDDNAASHGREVEALRARVTELEEELAAERARLERELDQIQASDRKRQQRVEELERQLSSATEAQQAALETAEQSKREFETLHRSNEALLEENQHLKTLAAAPQAGIPEGQPPEETKADVINNALRSRIGEQEKALDKAKTDLEASQARVSELEQGANETTQRIATLQGQLDEAQRLLEAANETPESIATLQGQLDEAQQLLEARNTRIGVLEGENGTAVAGVQELEKNLAALRTELDETRKSLNQCNERVSELDGKQHGDADLLAQERDRLRAELDEANNARREGQTEIGRLTTELQAARDNVAALTRERDDLQTRLNAATEAQRAEQEGGGGADVAALNRARDELQHRLDDATNARAHDQAEIHRLNEALTAQNVTDHERQTEIAMVQQRLDDAARRIQQTNPTRPTTRTAAAAGFRPWAAGGIFGANELPQDPAALRAEAVRLRTEVERVEGQLHESEAQRMLLAYRDPGTGWYDENVRELTRIQQDNANLRASVDTLRRQLRDAQERAEAQPPQ
ncbi:hypothetical protein PG985_002336 [Apiospora marii]|uniref:Uncharacterized protein n=1 Tax=Apiospora marii TaxID=335849 RepID=A0ABR1RSL0_9PEZI